VPGRIMAAITMPAGAETGVEGTVTITAEATAEAMAEGTATTMVITNKGFPDVYF